MAMANKFCCVLLIFDLFIFMPRIVNCKKSDPNRNKPQIEISHWIESDDYTWRNGNELDGVDFNDTVYYIPNDVYMLVLHCSANFPVQFRFEQLQPDLKFDESSLWRYSYMALSTTYRSTQNMYDPSTFKFGTMYVLYGSSTSASGRYTCENVEDTSSKTDMNIFWEGTAPPYLLNAGRSFQVTTHKANGQIVLPCILSVHEDEVGINLLRETNKTNENNETTLDFYEFEAKDSGISYRYDSFKGFVLDFGTNSSVEGRYKCVTLEMEDFVTTEVISEVIQKRPEYKEIISSGTKFAFDEKLSTFTCCSNSENAPKMLGISCSNPVACDSTRKLLESVNMDGNYYFYTQTNGSCSISQIWKNVATQVRCKGDGIDVIRRVIFSTEQRYPNGSQLYESYSRVSDVVPENLIRLFPGDDFYSRIWYLYPQYNYANQNPDRKYYAGQNTTFTCDTSPYYFADGAKMIVKSSNAKDALLQGSPDFKPEDIVKSWHFYQSFNTRQGYVVLDMGMTSVTCRAPVMNSRAWVEKSFNFQVQKPIFPSIKGDQEESISWTLNSTDPQTITCEVAGGDPNPDLKIMKQGKEITGDGNINIARTNVSIVLSFVHLAYGVHGDYVCVGTNLAGSYEKTFHVYIEEPHPWTATVIIILVSVALIAVIGIVVWRIKIQANTVSALQRANHE